MEQQQIQNIINVEYVRMCAWNVATRTLNRFVIYI